MSSIKGWRRRRAERRIAAALIYEAVVDIRTCAFSRDVCPDPETALERIRMLADTIHNLPGVFSRHAGPRGWPGSGYHAFYWLWTTASPEQKQWLVTMFSELEYDSAYLDRMEPWPVSGPPATSLSLRRGGVRMPRDSSSVKAIDTATYASLLDEAYERGLTSKRPDWVIAHLDPEATHVLLPKRPDDNFFGPREDGVWEYRVLARLLDGEVVVGHLRARLDSIEAVPAGVSRVEQIRLAALPVVGGRDLGLWSRDHRSTRPDCPFC